MDSFALPKSWFKKSILLVAAVLFVIFWFSLPNPLFNKPTCTVLESANDELLGAKIADDGQWRFPMAGSVPVKFEKAIILFEDKRFYSHFGIDLRALGRAFSQNIRNKKIVSGGSTISMQVIRLALNGNPRTVFQKTIETILAFRLELKYSKKEILSFYAANAPFGGNVVGLEAAAWRYFGKKTTQISWAEAATLAVLPNNPSIIRPGKNKEALYAKRNRLLKKLLEKNIIDIQSYQLAIEEPLPEKPHPLPQLTPHLLEKMALQNNQQRRTTIDADLQKNLNQLAIRHNQLLKNNEVHNLAIVVLDVESKKILGYIGNAPEAGFDHGQSVDVVQARRSTGSILKPLLFAMMMQEGELLPKSLIPDIPTYLQDFRPENFSNTYDGVVPATEALSRSLNIPFVRMLKDYGVEKFHFNLKKIGITTLDNGPNHYGLSLILGGAESTLWDLTNIYGSMAKRLNSFYKNNGWYDETDFEKADFQYVPNLDKTINAKLFKTTNFLTADAIWLTFNAMTELERPDESGDWQRFETHQKIAWKTGTSFGFRDAWAIGVNPKYAVGVWVGNADGEGRPGLTGVRAAAPILFDVFDQLPSSRWFDQPFDAMTLAATCKQSGYLAKEGCEIDSLWVSRNALNAPSCHYHQLIHLDESGKNQVTKECYQNESLISTYWFVLPPIEEYYFKPRHPGYKTLPAFLPGCSILVNEKINPIELEYPSFSAQIYVPIELDGIDSKVIFKAVHKNPNAIVFWHIDQEYIGSTKEFHSFELSPLAGKHVLTLVDGNGNRLEQRFEILTKDK